MSRAMRLLLRVALIGAVAIAVGLGVLSAGLAYLSRGGQNPFL